MVEIRITYETLFDLLRREKNREDLQKLDDDFYDQVLAYLLEKQQALLRKDDEMFISAEKEKLKIQFQNIRRIIKELYEKREKKVLNMAVVKARTGSDIIDTAPLLPSERRFFVEQVDILSCYKTDVLDRIIHLKEPKAEPEQGAGDNGPQGLSAPVLSERDEREDDQALPSASASSSASDSAPGHFVPASSLPDSRRKIKIVSSLPKFVGRNGEVLGPYEKDEVVELDDQIADVLVKKGRAEAC